MILEKALGGQEALSKADSTDESSPPVTGSVLLLVAAGDFCRACGTDIERRVGLCGACDMPLAGPVKESSGVLGAVYEIRRGLRKRLAVRLDSGDETAALLLSNGEEESTPQVDLPMSEDLAFQGSLAAELRTRRGRLVRLAVASQTGQIKHGWEPWELIVRALEGLAEVQEARGLAVDMMSLGRVDLLDRLPLSASEVSWLRAHSFAEAGDPAATVAQIVQLPERGYRQKLALLGSVWGKAKSDGVDLSPVLPHLTAYADEEPLAALLLRDEHPGAREDTSSTVLQTQQRLADRLERPGEKSALQTATAILVGDRVEREYAEALPRGLRVLAASQQALPGLLEPTELDGLDPATLDEIIDAGSVTIPEADLHTGGRSVRERYVRSRVAPETLSDAEVAELGLEDEIARRAFRYGAAETLGSLKESARVRHYRALLDIRKGRLREGLLDHVADQDREPAGDLVRLVEAKGTDSVDELLITERLLFDPTVWPVLVGILGAARLGRLSGLRERHPAFSEWLSLHEAREHLFLGNWRGAIDAASHCLELAKGEPVRDEAQNLKACGLFYLGDHLSAMQQLTEALEGAYSESLLANASLVAEGLAPEAAARHLGVLIREAPTLAMRVAAAHRAVLIWRSTDASLWRNSDESPLPDAFQDALRELVNDQITLDDFRRFASVLALSDGKWFGEAANTTSSPHNDSLEARFYRARTAPGLVPTVTIMGEAIAAGDAPAWLLHERDELRDAAVDILFRDLDEPDSTFGSVALAMVDRGVLADDYDNCLFNMLGIATLAYHLTEEKTTIDDASVARLHAARKAAANLPGDGPGRLKDLTELATRRVALNRYLPIEREFNRGVELYNSSLDLGRNQYPGSPVYQQALARTREALAVARQVREAASQWLLLVEHDGLRNDYKGIVTGTQDLERRCLNVLN